MPLIKDFEVKIKYLAKQSCLVDDIKTLRELAVKMDYKEKARGVWNYYFDRAKDMGGAVDFPMERLDSLLGIFKLKDIKNEFCNDSFHIFKAKIEAIRESNLPIHDSGWYRLFQHADYDEHKFYIIPQARPELPNHRLVEDDDEDELLDSYKFPVGEQVHLSVSGPKGWYVTLLERSPKGVLECLRPSPRKSEPLQLTGQEMRIPENKPFRVPDGALGQFICLALITRDPIGLVRYRGLWDDSSAVRSAALNDLTEHLSTQPAASWKAYWRAYWVTHG